MKIPRLVFGSAIMAVGLFVSGCVSSGYGPGPVYYGGYGGAYSGRYVYTQPRVVPAPRYRNQRVYRPRPVYQARPVYPAPPQYRPTRGDRPPPVYTPRRGDTPQQADPRTRVYFSSPDRGPPPDPYRW